MKFIPTAILLLILAISTNATQPSVWTGVLLFRTAGTTCPTGTTEATDISGRSLVSVTFASGEAGQTGGNDNITPSGTSQALTFTGSALGTHLHGIGTYDNAAITAGTPAGTNSALTFTGSALGTHSHGVGTYDNAAITAGTPAGTNSALTFTGTLSTTIVNHLHTLATGTTATGNFSQVIGTVDTSSGGTGGTPTQTALGTLSGNPTSGGAANYTPAGTINTPAFTGSSMSTHDHTFSGSSEALTAGTPAGTINTPIFTGSALATHDHTISGSSESISGGTPAGTINTPTFTGTQFDNRSAFIKVVACRVD